MATTRSPRSDKRPRVVQAAHVVALEIRRLLVDEQHEPDAALLASLQIAQ